MKTKNKSIFNLIEIFGQGNKTTLKIIDAQSHCEQKQHHDYYCDAEKTFISI